MFRLPRIAIATLLSVSCIAAVAQAPAAPRYRLTVLKQFDRNHGSYDIGGINNRGDIVYSFDSESGEFSATWMAYASGGTVDLGLPNHRSSSIDGYNDRGDIVGTSDGPSQQGVFHPVVVINGVQTQLDANGRPILSAYSINNQQQVVGTMVAPDGTQHGYIYDGRNFTQLGTLGGAASEATDINDRGQVLGAAQTSDGSWHPYLYDHGTMTDLTTPGGWSGTPTAINDEGQIIGRLTDGTDQAFFYADGKMRVIGIPGEPSQAYAINDLGQVIGFMGPSLGIPFLWQDGQLYDLSALTTPNAYSFLHFGGINDNGQIVGRGCGLGPSPASDTCALFELDPVPEPSTWAMLLPGLFVLAWRLARRNRIG